jgi:Ca-activated chloride channel family protein
VSFAAPLFLLGLLAVPALAILYVAYERRRGAARATFATSWMAPSVLPRRPGWRRQVPIGAFALAVIVLIVAAARPQAKVAAPTKRSSVMLLIDTSSSMASTDVAPTRLDAVRAAANRFLASAPSRVSVGLLAFSKTPSVVQPPTGDRAVIRSDLASLYAHSGTAIGNAIQAALRILAAAPKQNGTRPPAAIVLLSDGTSDSGVDQLAQAREAGREHVPIYTVALGTPTGTIKINGVVHPAPPDPQALAQIAQASGGQTYAVRSAGRLSAVYEHLGAQLGHHTVKQEITPTFAGAGLVLLLIGSGLSLLWLRRLI